MTAKELMMTRWQRDDEDNHDGMTKMTMMRWWDNNNNHDEMMKMTMMRQWRRWWDEVDETTTTSKEMMMPWWRWDDKDNCDETMMTDDKMMKKSMMRQWREDETMMMRRWRWPWWDNEDNKMTMLKLTNTRILISMSNQTSSLLALLHHFCSWLHLRWTWWWHDEEETMMKRWRWDDYQSILNLKILFFITVTVR